LIKFYNEIFVGCAKECAYQLAKSQSPHTKRKQKLPWFSVSKSLKQYQNKFYSTDTENLLKKVNHKIVYTFGKSPNKILEAINRMLTNPLTL